MKTYWDRIYDVFDQAAPGMFDRDGRRKAIERFVRTYPEEVWPIERKKGAS